MPMRFVLALLVAAILIGGGFVFVASTRQLTETLMEKNVAVSRATIIRIQTADLLHASWKVSVPFVLAICLAVAALTGPRKPLN